MITKLNLHINEYDKTEQAKETKDNRKTEYEYISLQEIAQN